MPGLFQPIVTLSSRELHEATTLTSRVSHSSNVVLISPGLASALPRFVLVAPSVALPPSGNSGFTCRGDPPKK